MSGNEAEVRVSAIVAAAENDVIGTSGRLPWYLPEDLRHFARLTRGHVLVSGRRTYCSVLERLGRPLDGRVMVVATRSSESPQPAPHETAPHETAPAQTELPEFELPEFDTVVYRSSVRTALSTARALEQFAGGCEVFVIGGAQMYAQTAGDLDRVYLTRVHAEVDGDVRIPPGWLDAFTLTTREAGAGGQAGDGLAYSFERYDRREPR